MINLKLPKLFNLNGFPPRMSDSDCIVHYILHNTLQPKPLVLSTSNKIIYFCLPFTRSPHSLQICTQVSRLCNAAFPHLDIRFVFRSSTHISSFLSFTDKVPKYLHEIWCCIPKCEVSMLFRVVCGLNHTTFTQQSLQTLRNLSHYGKTFVQPLNVQYLITSGHSACFDDF